MAAAQESKNKSPKEDLKKEDPDPYGDAYENDAEPLEQAMKFVERAADARRSNARAPPSDASSRV